MATRYVVDTNVLVYTLDRREPEKRERAREVLRRKRSWRGLVGHN
jgi:predicted nucleic acid-binding protein